MSNWKIIKEEDDPMALRISIGSPHEFDHKKNGYIVYRGDATQCLELIETAVSKLKKHIEEQPNDTLLER